MKEAAGEANLTVVAIILIAVVVAVATPLICSLMQGAQWKSCCTDNGGIVQGNQCMINGRNRRNNIVNANGECVQVN